jgi:GTP cyclohydrolase I
MIDIQGQKDQRGLGIEYVGIKDIRVPLVLRINGKKKFDTIATLALYTNLAPHERGTHLSRYVEVLNQHRSYALSDIILRKIVSQIQKSLKTTIVQLEVTFPYPITKVSPITKKAAVDTIDCVILANKNREEFQKSLTVKVPIMLLCPCSKAISKQNAHNQRALASLTVVSKKNMSIEESTKLLEEEASCRLYPLLKRADEKYVTEYSYDNPKFVEDYVRDVAIRLKKHQSITSFTIRCESYESIHSHNAYAELSYNK